MSNTFAGEFRITQVHLVQKTDKVVVFAPIASSEGSENDVVTPYVYGPFEQKADLVVYSQIETERVSIEVDSDRCNVYRPQIIKYLPDEFAIKDYDDDLKDYLQVVAVSMDEFYCFIEEFTTIFDPDKCQPKYLPYLAKLINWPLNTRGFDSEVPSVKDAAISRARKQLRQAVEVYKRKGLKEAFQILFYALGYYIELVELWTNNYINFVDQVPAGERLYDPETNPSGWFKAPYFGIRLTSLNQSIEISTGGEGQPWNFDPDDLREILDAIDSIRPVHTVLYWINYYFDLVEKFEFTDLDLDGGVSWEPNDEFFNCSPGDPVYLRDDRRLDGITRNGTDSISIDMVRDPQPGICDPDIGIEAELGDINWDVDPWCTPALRDGGMLFRDGYNTNPRNGIVPTRDPSAFGGSGRNGFYYRDTPLAPFDSDSPNGLVWDRSGCYTPGESSFVPLYQIAEESEDGVELYYNEHEFKTWLDSMTAGFGIDPDLTGTGVAPHLVVSASSLSITAVYGNVMVDGGTDLFSMFGFDSDDNMTQLVSRLIFSSGMLTNTQTVVPSGSVTSKYARGVAGYFNGVIYYACGLIDAGSGIQANTDLLAYNIASNTLSIVGSCPKRVGAGFAQFGTKLYVFGGLGDVGGTVQSTYFTIDMQTVSIGSSVVVTPMEDVAVVAVNEMIYGILGVGGTFGRLNTITGLVETLSLPPMTGRLFGIKRNNLLMFFESTTGWSNSSFDKTTYLEYDLTTSNWTLKPLIDNVSGELTPMIAKAGRFYGAGNGLGNVASSVVQIFNFS